MSGRGRGSFAGEGECAPAALREVASSAAQAAVEWIAEELHDARYYAIADELMRRRFTIAREIADASVECRALALPRDGHPHPDPTRSPHE